MIYLSRADLEANLDPGWAEIANQARDALFAADQSSVDPEQRVQARKKVIDDNEKIWKDKRIKNKMRDLSFNKCWYCETEETRSDTAVDHFRPKNGVKECIDHPGYWWLAFDWSNYRYSCTFCNEKRKDEDTKITGGKGTNFPLVDPDARLYEPGDLTVEKPVLLDPLEEQDVLLLSFNPDGTAISFYSEKERPVFYKRATDSILYYNLNQKGLKERRQKLICETIKELVAEGDKYFSRSDNAQDRSAQEAFGDILKKLSSMISPKAEYSATAKCMLSNFQDRPWVYTFMRSRMV